MKPALRRLRDLPALSANRAIGVARRVKTYLALPPAAKREHRRDRRRGLGDDPGPVRAIDEALAWLSRAQDHSASHDGGVARHYSLVHGGWGASYPETTGCVIPTFITAARQRGDPALRERARKMLDWLVTIQLPGGGFQGGTVGARPAVPVTFNTGQVLLGLASGVEEFGTVYRAQLRASAEWLVTTQDADGCWRRHPTPFAAPGEKTYETHVAWGLLEAARVEPRQSYVEAAVRNVRWALTHQASNGWFSRCCLEDPMQPLTHTLGYALHGLIETYRFTGERALLDASRRTADGVLGALTPTGFLPGRLDANWNGTVRWACLTGTVQFAQCWLLLYQETDDRRYREAGFAANRFVRRTMHLDGVPETRGGIKGSFPVSGVYCPYEYPNWACAFFIDANVLETRIREAGS